MRTVVLVVTLVMGLASVALADAVIEGKVTDLLGKPVPDVRVHVVTGGENKVVQTDKNGNYQVVVDGNRQVSVVVGAGDLHTFRGGQLRDGTRHRLDFELEISDGEVIHIIDNRPPAVPPKLKHEGPRRTPPYSEAAVVRDAWAKAWLLLDISETGKVLRVKLVKRPGFDLDEIAVKEAMKLQFAPALDGNGKPMRTSMFWAMEWPSHGWLVEHAGTATRLPEESFVIDVYGSSFSESVTRVTSESINGGPQRTDTFSAADAPRLFVANPGKSLRGVRCAGTGPLNLDERYPVYRDCSTPNRRKLPYLPWLDGTQPIPPDPPEIAEQPEPPLRLTRASYIPQITASAATAAVLTGWIYAYAQKSKYEDRLTAVSSSPTPLTTAEERDQYIRDVAGFQRWQRRWTIMSLAVIGSTGVSALLWFRHMRKADFSVQPESSGASLSLSGRF